MLLPAAKNGVKVTHVGCGSRKHDVRLNHLHLEIKKIGTIAVIDENYDFTVLILYRVPSDRGLILCELIPAEFMIRSQ